MKNIHEKLKELDEKGNFRRFPKENSRELIDLSSNDYLGLSDQWKLYFPSFLEMFPDCGFSSSASRLLSSRQYIFELFEGYLEELYNRCALLYNSGYHANTGTISALAKIPSTLFICDKLVHASIFDGLMIGKAVFKRFQHNNVLEAEKIITAEADKYDNIILVIESIYSMEGTIAPLNKFCDLKKRFNNLYIYLDEAHAFGVRGVRGLGLAEESGLIDKIDIIVGTLGKAAASMGAFLITDQEIKSYLINTSRSLIYSTALPPINVAWSFFMTKKITLMSEERIRLKKISLLIRDKIKEISGYCSSESQIIPLITGDSKKAVDLAAILKRQWNILALPIRRPTVPPGKECVRLSLSNSLTDQDIEIIINGLGNFRF